MPRCFRLLGVPAALAALGACSYVPHIPGITPFKPEIRQGNYLSQDLVAQLKPGMTREQVRYLLGTPLLTDIFHAERWDYVYWREDEAGRRETRKIALFFNDGKLERVTGDVVSPAAGR
jgi:outer membrane protein assembly factor BamE